MRTPLGRTKNRKGLELNGTLQLFVCGDDANLLRENINIIKKTTETLIGASKSVGLEAS
jgi:hypothetical protein